ncbi:MAG: hypothetical protein WDN06_05615 [Asticcacaulis sp.]
MTKKQISFFAVEDEIVEFLVDAARVMPCEIYEAGMFDSVKNIKINDFSNIQPFKNYLVVFIGQDVTPRVVPQRLGKAKFAFDQLINPNTAVLSIGGLYNENHLISSQFGTATSYLPGLALVESFRKVLKKSCVKIKSYYVSNIALKMLKDGIDYLQHQRTLLNLI